MRIFRIVPAHPCSGYFCHSNLDDHPKSQRKLLPGGQLIELNSVAENAFHTANLHGGVAAPPAMQNMSTSGHSLRTLAVRAKSGFSNLSELKAKTELDFPSGQGHACLAKLWSWRSIYPEVVN